jgi:hypothetical protein
MDLVSSIPICLVSPSVGVEASWGPQLASAKAVGFGVFSSLSCSGNSMKASRGLFERDEKDMP